MNELDWIELNLNIIRLLVHPYQQMDEDDHPFHSISISTSISIHTLIEYNKSKGGSIDV